MTDSTGTDTTLVTELGPGWRENLEANVASQLEQYGALDALSERQRSCIESGDTDRLMGLLGEREGLIASISETVGLFGAFADRWERIEEALPEREWRDLRRRLDAVASIASAIAARDAEDTGLIAEHKDELASKLRGVTKNRAAAQAYAGPRKGGPRYQDREA